MSVRVSVLRNRKRYRESKLKQGLCVYTNCNNPKAKGIFCESHKKKRKVDENARKRKAKKNEMPKL